MILTDDGHIVLAEAMYAKDFYLTWGTLDSGQWTTPPREDNTIHNIIKPVGTIKAEVKEFVNLDVNGSIETDSAKWSISGTPTRYLYLKFMFRQDNNPDDIIYQLGIHYNPQFSVDPTTIFHNKDDVTDWGKLLLTENVAPIYRNNSTKEHFEYVITF